MTVTSEVSVVKYDGNADADPQTFSITYYFLDNDDIEVTLYDTDGVASTLVEGTHYNLVGEGETDPVGGTITMIFTPTDYRVTVGQQIQIERTLELLQPDDYSTGGKFRPPTMERSLDRIVMLIQSIYRTSVQWMSGQVDVTTMTFAGGEYANGAASAIDWNNGQKQSAAPSGIITFVFIDCDHDSNASTLSAGNFLLKLIDGNGNAPTWPANVKWPYDIEPNWSGGTDLIGFYFDGTDYYGALMGSYDV